MVTGARLAYNGSGYVCAVEGVDEGVEYLIIISFKSLKMNFLQTGPQTCQQFLMWPYTKGRSPGNICSLANKMIQEVQRTEI